MPEHPPCRDIEGRQQDLRTVPFVLVFIPDRAVASDVRRMSSLESLHGLLVDAHDHRALRRIEVEVADSLRLRQEVRVLAVQPLRDVMRTDLLEPEDAPDLAGAQAVAGLGRQNVGQRAVGPHVPEPHDLVIGTLAGQPHQ